MTDSPNTPPNVPDDLLRTAAAAFEDLLAILGPDGTFHHCNRRVVDVTGYTDDELASMGPEGLVVEADVDRIQETVVAARNDGQASLETTLVTSTGEEIPYEIRGAAMDGDDSPVAIVGRDITERKRAQRERRAILDRMTDAFFALNEDWQFTYVNEQAEPILSAAMGRDITAAEMEGIDIWEEIPEVIDTPFYDQYHEAMRTQEAVTLEAYYEPLDTWFEVRAYPSETGISVYFRDVTERHHQREILEQRDSFLRDVYDVTADTDRSFAEQVETLLELGCDVLGTDYGSLSQIRGDEYEFEFVHAPDGSIQAGDTVDLSATNCERTAATADTVVLGDISAEAPELTAKDGYAEWGISCYIGAPILVDGEVYGTFCFYDDEPRAEGFSEWETTLVDLMSQWVSYELTKQHSHARLERQNEQLEEFATIVSHDIRNPLNVLVGSLEIAQETGDQATFDRCQRAIERMETLIEDVLSLARAGDRITDPEPVEAESLLETCWENVATPDATLVVENVGSIRIDENRVQQLLENLFRNSVEHGGGDVTVTVGGLDDGFFVADDGPGIPPAEREQVFDAGFTTADQGTGLGLNIVKQVADAHGWTVRAVESEAGGVRFEFTGA